MTHSFVLALLALLATAEARAAGDPEVTRHGLGSAKFGMTLAQLNDALRESLVEPTDPVERGCYYVEPKAFEGVAMMMERGKLRRIDVHSRGIKIEGGVGIETDIASLKARFGHRLTDEPHQYTGPEDRYLTVRLSPKVSARFETRGTKVAVFYVGHAKQVQYVEGCQ